MVITRPPTRIVPACKMGYTESQLQEILGAENLAAFWEYMRGQTVCLCEGREYNHETKSYVPACNGVAHGTVVYPWDLETYLQGLPPLD